MVEMSQRSVLLPGDFVKTKQQDLGVFVLSRIKLEKLHVQSPKIACIPHSTLKLIADANNLSPKLSALLRDISFSDPVSLTKITKTITQLITKATIPQSITQELVQNYHSYFKSKTMRVFPGDSVTGSQQTPFTKIKGDATVLQSFLACWAYTVQKRVLHTRTRFPHIALHSFPMILEEELDSQASGEVYTRNPETGNKTSVLITTTGKSSYEVDIRTWNIIKRHISPSENNKQHILSETLLKSIARMANTIKKQHLSHQKITWVAAQNQLYCVAVEEYTHLQEPSDTRQKSITKLYISAGNPQQIHHNEETVIDGVGLLKSEFTYLKYGTHPYALLKGHGKELLFSSLLDALTMYSDSVHGKQVILRSHDLTSTDLARLEHSTTYESVEANPFIGHRGSLRTIMQPELFNLELEVLKAFVKKSSGHVGFMLPFARTPSELQQLIRMLEETNLRSHTNFSVWWQIDTPENVLNCAAYPLTKIDGISVNISTIQSLLYGIDPTNPAVAERYATDTSVLTTLLATLMKQCRSLEETHGIAHSIPIIAQFEQYDPRLVQALVQQGIDGITVKPNVAPLAKACIIDIEEQPLLEKTTTKSNAIVL